MLSPCGLATTRTLSSYRYAAYDRIPEWVRRLRDRGSFRAAAHHGEGAQQQR